MRGIGYNGIVSVVCRKPASGETGFVAGCKDRGAMSNQKILSAVGAVLCLVTFCADCFGYSGGTGDPNNPFQISTVDDWLEMVDASADWDKHFILLNDIDFGGITLTPVAPDTQQDIYFYDGIPFSGYFDGNGHIIRNAVISHPDQIYVGLFGYVNQYGRIQNLGVENATIAGSSDIGGLVGENGGEITACFFRGNINGNHIVGGLCGWNYGTITDCFATVNIVGGNNLLDYLAPAW